MIKLIDAIKGGSLCLFSLKTLDPKKKFRNKRIAIVGPADSAYQVERGDYIDEFDFVIRINKAPHSWTPEKSKFIGKKTDIWFHSFFENNDSGGGPLDITLIKSKNIKFLVNPRTDFSAFRRTFNFYRKYKKPQTVYHLPSKVYKGMLGKFPQGLKPTIGFTALYSALNSECKELFITGFTFFKTPYAKGYRDHLRDLDVNKKHFKKQNIHDADLEFEFFKEQLAQNQCDKVELDNTLNQILESE